MTTSESTAVASSSPATTPATAPAPQAAAAAPVVPGPSSASLYVGELNPEVTEAMLFELFNQIGPVSSIRICRDAITRRSLGYGYVNYHNVADGERALEQLNYAPVKGAPCRIMWSQRDPSVRRSGDGNVFIKNLDPSIDNKALHDLFSAFGAILSCKVTLDDQGQSKGYGFVHYELRESAEKSIASLNGMLLNDMKVFVGHHVSRKERLAQFDALKASFTNVFVKNLEETVEDEELARIFAPFGTVTSAIVSRDETTGRSKGFGFVNFADHEAAERAVAELNGSEMHGRQLYVGRAQKKAERDEDLRRQFEALKLERSNKFAGVNLYVKNLAETIDDEKLRVEFAPFGTVTSCKVMTDEKGTSRGFGFVCFSSPEESARAVGEMNGRMLASKPLYVAFAQRKDERRMQLEAQYSARAQQMRYQQQMAAAAAAASGFPAGVVPPGAIPPMFYAPPPAARYGMGPGRPGPMGAPVAGMAPPVGGMMRPPRPMRPAYRTNAPMGGAPPGQYPPHQSGMRRPYVAGQQPPHKGARRPEPLTAAALAAASPEQQKRLLGERLFPLVASREPEAASKITGMLLEMDNAELLHLIESPEALSAKVAEAVDVLRQHSAAQVVDA